MTNPQIYLPMNMFNPHWN